MFKDDVKTIAAMPNIAGYAIVAWDKKRGYEAQWNAPLDGPMPSTAMPDYVKTSLLREIVKSDTRNILRPDNEEA